MNNRSHALGSLWAILWNLIDIICQVQRLSNNKWKPCEDALIWEPVFSKWKGKKNLIC